MPRRPATITQADVARTIRAAKQTGAESVEVRPDGTIAVMLKGVSVAPTPPIPTAPDGDPDATPKEIVL